jgi:hypothetical protein
MLGGSRLAPISVALLLIGAGFRLRFSVPQSELENGFALRMTGLQREGEAARVPIMRFE